MNKLETIVVINYALYDTDDASWNLSRMINTYRMRYEYAPDDGQYSEHMMNVAMKWAKGEAKVALKSAKKLWNGRDDDDDNEELQNVIDYLAMTITNPDGLNIPDKIKYFLRRIPVRRSYDTIYRHFLSNPKTLFHIL